MTDIATALALGHGSIEMSVDVGPKNVYNATNIRQQMGAVWAETMSMEAAMGQLNPLQARLARGTPIRVRGRTLTPVARIVSAVQHRATIRSDRVEASGWGFVRTQPLELVEERNGVTLRYPIPDRTRTVLGQMALMALLIPALCAAVIALAHRARGPKSVARRVGTERRSGLEDGSRGG